MGDHNADNKGGGEFTVFDETHELPLTVEQDCFDYVMAVVVSSPEGIIATISIDAGYVVVCSENLNSGEMREAVVCKAMETKQT